MIHVNLKPEPADFDAKVRRPGRDALASGVTDLPAFWRECLLDLHRAYDGICAYLCIYIPRGTGARTVEHFAPKSGHRDLAYEWSNYRLVCSLLNARKRDFQDVLDPFDIPDGMFVMEFSFFQLAPSPSPKLSPQDRQQVVETIRRLKLNDEECCTARGQYYLDYSAGEVSFAHVQKRSPFVAREMLRLGLVREDDRPHV